MRHNKKQNPKLGRSTREQRKALIRSLLSSFLIHGRVKTTRARAKALQPVVERLIANIKKKDSVNAIREAKRLAYTTAASKRAIEFAEKFRNRSSGFTRITNLEIRQGDAAQIVLIEFVE